MWNSILNFNRPAEAKMVKPHLKATGYTNKHTHHITHIKIDKNKFTLQVLLALSLPTAHIQKPFLHTTKAAIPCSSFKHLFCTYKIKTVLSFHSIIVENLSSGT